MAESDQTSRAADKYFCHECSREISVKLPDYTCETCGSGFIEQITDTNGESVQREPAEEFHDLWGRMFLDAFLRPRGRGATPPFQFSTGVGPRGAGVTAPPNRTAEVEDEDADIDESYENGNEVNGTTGQGRGQGRGRRTGPTYHHIRLNRGGPGGPGSGTPPSIELILQQLLGGFGGALGGSPVIIGGPPLHGNPGDYAWGPGGLDSIISQLLNQLEGSGPPPADQSMIDSLPTVIISQKQADECLQCSVCFEDFTSNEETKKLPCNHHFHQPCIEPWLKLHGTCPVCRIDLNGVDTSRQDAFANATPGPSSRGPHAQAMDDMDQYE